MNIIGFIWGIIAFLWMGIALIPFLGWLNWMVIPFAAIGLIISILGYVPHKNSLGLVGLVLNGIVIVIGLLRLFLGGGFL